MEHQGLEAGMGGRVQVEPGDYLPTNLLKAVEMLKRFPFVNIVTYNHEKRLSREEVNHWFEALRKRGGTAKQFQVQLGEDVSRRYQYALTQDPSLVLGSTEYELDKDVSPVDALHSLLDGIVYKRPSHIFEGYAVNVYIRGTNDSFYLTDLEAADFMKRFC